ncbi:MAG: hypothetical protein QOH06_3836 [Acidobacteriota bacterium]|jgi:hypothetical protein|nr:hypothetical protein [Acidobacteriota bacterium]
MPNLDEISFVAKPSLPDRHTCPPSQYFLGNPAWDIYCYGDKIQVLVCECGEQGCWPLVCRIEVGDDRVIWSDFEQPYRAAEEQARLGLRGFRTLRVRTGSV